MNNLLKYFPQLTEIQKQQFAQLQPLYAEWNSKINVISRKDIDNLYVNHVLHSLSIAKVVSFADGTHILDVGTGGGFPGIPLAIMFPKCHFHLIDGIGKKIIVVNAVIEALKLQNAVAEHVRAEQLTSKYDFVVSRAVTRFDNFCKLAQKSVSSTCNSLIANGIIYLKGGDFADELKTIRRPLTIYNISDYFNEPFFETKKIIHLAV